MDGFHAALPIDLALLAGMRHSLSGWMESVGVADPPRADVVLATHEAVANAMEHAGSDESVNVDATFLSGDLIVEVSDQGTWKERLVPDDPERGRGIKLIKGLVAEVDLKGTSGTTLRITEHA